MLSLRSKNRAGFTVIEVMIATAIIAIIAVSASLSFLKTRLNARNSQRKEVAQTYSKAVGSYAAASGSTFITTDGNVTSCTSPTLDGSGTTSAYNPGIPVTITQPNTCVGANGRGYGMLDFTGKTSEKFLTQTLTFDYGSGNSTNTTSIASALKQLGYLGTISADPLVTLTNNSVKTTDPDYILVRCCKDGRQAIGDGGSLYAIWAKLETGGSNDPTSFDANSQHLCGGPQVVPPGFNASSNPYTYSFGGAKNTPATDSYSNSWFASGPATVAGSQVSLNDPCEKNA